MEVKKGVWMKEKVDSRSSPSSLPRRCFAVVCSSRDGSLDDFAGFRLEAGVCFSRRLLC